MSRVTAEEVGPEASEQGLRVLHGILTAWPGVVALGILALAWPDLAPPGSTGCSDIGMALEMGVACSANPPLVWLAFLVALLSPLVWMPLTVGLAVLRPRRLPGLSYLLFAAGWLSLAYMGYRIMSWD